MDVARESVHQAFDAFREILEEHRQQMLNELETLHERHERQMNETFETISRTSEKVIGGVLSQCKYSHFTGARRLSLRQPPARTRQRH